MENEQNKKTEKGEHSTSGMKKNLGRTKGSQNILTKEMKQLLFDTLKKDYKKLDKLLNACSCDERAIQLKHFSKYLANGDDEIAKMMREILWEQLEGHYKKLRFYIPQLTAKQKITVLRSFLNDLTPHDRKKAIEDINEQDIKFD
jgi:hypothetical protein